MTDEEIEWLEKLEWRGDKKMNNEKIKEIAEENESFEEYMCGVSNTLMWYYDHGTQLRKIINYVSTIKKFFEEEELEWINKK